MKLSIIIYISIVMFSLLEFSCAGDSSTESTSDSTSTTMPSTDITSDSSQIIPNKKNTYEHDSSRMQIDTQSIVNNTTKIRSAVFGYSFFKNIQEHETRNINAYVMIINAISRVIDTLKEINESDIPERKNDTATIITKNIFVFKAIDVQLLNAGDSDFIIKPFANAGQLIDSINGNSWTWAITPRTDKLHGRLVMNIIAEKPDGSRQPFSTINIPITIIIDKQINRTLWEWMMTNPEKVFTIILMPFIIFFWKQITGLFKKKT